jgi:hypothetical protein
MSTAYLLREKEKRGEKELNKFKIFFFAQPSETPFETRIVEWSAGGRWLKSQHSNEGPMEHAKHICPHARHIERKRESERDRRSTVKNYVQCERDERTEGINQYGNQTVIKLLYQGAFH